MDESVDLLIMLVEDDVENLDLLIQSLPDTMLGCKLHYEPFSSFDEAAKKLKWQRYDMVLTDIYRNREDGRSKINEEDALARDIVTEIRTKRFCPVVAFTDGSFPASLVEKRGPFLKLADKTKKDDEDIVAAMKDILDTRIPQIAKTIHDELDQVAGPRYLWDFLEKHWEKLLKCYGQQSPTIERLIRRRAAIQLGKLDPSIDEALEFEQVSAPEFYIMPPVTKNFRLGNILKKKDTGGLYVIATPHCHLAVQKNDVIPRADHVLLVSVVPFIDVIKAEGKKTSKNSDGKKDYGSVWTGDSNKWLDKLRKILQSPSQFGVPKGRYWFLPGLLDIPDSFCDFMVTNSVPYNNLVSDFEAIATLDTPFAEAFQSCFLSFYSSIGLPNQSIENYKHLITNPVKKE